MGKVRIENVGVKLDKEAKTQRVELTADEKKLPKEQQDQIRTEREQQVQKDERGGDLLRVQVFEQQHNPHTGGDQERIVSNETLEPGKTLDLDVTDKKRVSVSFV